MTKKQHDLLYINDHINIRTSYVRHSGEPTAQDIRYAGQMSLKT